jgi:hypothetical protein
MKWNGDKVMDWTGLYPGILHSLKKIFHEQAAQIILVTVLKAMDEISQYTLCLVIGHYAVKSRLAVLAARAKELSLDEPIEWSGTTAAERLHDSRRGRFAVVTEKSSKVLRTSAPHTVGRIKQLNQCIKQVPNQIPHAGKSSKL